MSKGHDLFATMHGKLTIDNDRAMIDRLWNRFAAAWFEAGKDDPSWLLRFEPERAQIWLNEFEPVAAGGEGVSAAIPRWTTRARSPKSRWADGTVGEKLAAP